MRLPARRIATSALCATLLLGVTGPAAVAADSASAQEHTRAASRAPVPDADELLGQVESLGGLGGVLVPVADLLTAVLKADDGQLPHSQAAELSTSVQDAIDHATAAAPAATATPGATSSDTPLPQASTLPAPVEDGTELSEGLTAEALAALEKATDGLVKAVTSGESAQVAPAVHSVVAGLVNAVAATLVGSELPAPDLAGLPSLPKAP
ncbi:hypothetical protein AB0I06_29500 [Streptomyces sp. NPDC050674]|uniref:hypothetical protein n=1 Tax=Streptomyces sp. NPDC050674 TaxID=3157216 RepID=UPI00341E208E